MLRRNSDNGFTLIEAVLALLLLSWVGIGVISLFKQLSAQNSKAILSMVALYLGQEKMEMISNDRVRLDYGGIQTSLYPAQTVTQNGISYTRSVLITEVSPTDLSTPLNGSGLKKIEVSVKLSSETNALVKLNGLIGNY